MDPRLEDVEAILERTPKALRGLLGGLSDDWLAASEGEGTFTPRDVLGHLIHGERTDWMPRLRIILDHGEARPFDKFDRFAQREASRGIANAALLDTFEALRAENLAALRALRLTSEQLALRGRHPELGGVTLGQLLATWAVHDLNHVAQITRVMSREYDAAVGPWKQYLGILHWKT